ncbi:hypothetical protein [Streptomyces sp. SAS_270]|uniref:hypothetical protein n=1 Tax=Streptomyces sp. SAS_270 TaxID=3412748 RepID=UPI00403D00B7
MAGARITTGRQVRPRYGGLDALRVEAERWHEFLQARFEEVERRPKYHRMLGEAYGRLTAHLDHGDVEAATEPLNWMRAEAQFLTNHPDFPSGPAEAYVWA